MKVETVLVLSRHDGHELSESSREMLTAARNVADRVVSATFGEPPVAELARYGADEILAVDPATVEAAGADPNHPAVWSALAVAAAKQVNPRAVFLASSYLGKEIAAQTAVTLDSGVITDADSVTVDNNQLSITKAVFSGSWATSGEIIRGIPVVALRPTAVEAVATDRTEATVTPLTIEVPERAGRTRLVSRTVRENTGPNLTESQVVVVGGRGLDGDFGPARELAELLGGAVGATRVACDEGWIDRSAQIGQTGETIAPKLYIGLGVSGAVHHTSGMLASETIVAISDDAEAPIFEIADFGVVGDLDNVLPQAIAELKKAGL
ncbi:electron transfer flavoprotein subunit alpha/FixB family protein [Flaviflexus massiliensis]|uniref:electron transfer flavoprotein subunit alpha/FixB family protein n=1 Tax=Flaviflexus massiliensis TaxID=1522309 RepID=UPI00097DC975|nr:electron transfer flavoprotein subunit alpha/FixB family protein [Flaviflexus massiliensis]